MDNPEIWQWIWMATAAAFIVGEMTTAGSFFLLPFGVAAGVSTILAFADVSVTGQWLAFFVVALVSFIAMRPLAKRLNQQGVTEGIGARRLVGAKGVAIGAIPGSDQLGMVRVEREEWRAQSASGAPISPGTEIYVVDVEGTRVLVSTTPPPPGANT